MLLLKSFFLIYIYVLSCLHPVHVSVTNMEYFKENNEIEFSIKVFKDDFQLLFFHLGKNAINFNNPDEIEKNMDLIKGYFQKNFKIIINDSNTDIYLKDYNLLEDAVWFKFNAPIKSKILSIKLINTVLLDLYFDQKNLLIFKAEDFENGYRFDIKNKEYLIEF